MGVSSGAEIRGSRLKSRSEKPNADTKEGSLQRIIYLYFTLSLCMSCFTASRNLLCGLTFLLLPTWQLHLQHPLSNISTVSPLNMSKPSQLCLSDFVSKLLDLSCPSQKPYNRSFMA